MIGEMGLDHRNLVPSHNVVIEFKCVGSHCVHGIE